MLVENGLLVGVNTAPNHLAICMEILIVLAQEQRNIGKNILVQIVARFRMKLFENLRSVKFAIVMYVEPVGFLFV
jgi:hypothetical protein